MTKNTLAFRKLLADRGLNCRQVSEAIKVHKVTVRLWHCGMAPVPEKRMQQVKALK